MEENTSKDNAELTSEQLDALQMFTSVTNQDVKDAIPLLQRSEWNVQIAITKFFDGERADPLEEARSEAEAVPAHARTSGVLLDGLGPSSVHHRGIRRGREQPAGASHGGRGQGQGGWRPPLLLAIIFSPVTIVYRIIASGFELLLDLWRGPPPPAPRPRVASAVSHEQHARQTLRKEQESAYEKSLRQDQEKTRLRREAEAKKSKEEQQAKAREAWRCWRASKIVPEPAASMKEVCRLSIRMPDGERVIRRFPADSDVEEIYAFVETRGIQPKDEALPTKPDNYIHQYGFKLVQAIPRAVYDTNFGAINRIGRSANLIVEYLEEDEADDESNKE